MIAENAKASVCCTCEAVSAIGRTSSKRVQSASMNGLYATFMYSNKESDNDRQDSGE